MKRFIPLWTTALLLVAGCGYYSFSGSLPSHVKTAAVPLFGNETTEVGMVEYLTDAIEKAFISNGAMKVVSEFQADAVVTGTIVDVIDGPESFTGEEQGTTFRIRGYANGEFIDRVRNEPLWTGERVEGWAVYDAPSSPGATITRDEAKEQALDMLAKEIIDKTVTGW